MKKTALIALFFAACSLISSAQATTWDWSFANESGQFVTSGSGSAAGTYTLTDFTVTSSAVGATIGSLTGGDYATGSFSTDPPFSFDWDGTTVTAWHHSGLNSFNWWVFDDVPGPGEYFFAWDSGNINDPTMAAYWEGEDSVAALGKILVTTSTSVPDAGGTLALLAAAVSVLVLMKRPCVQPVG